MTSDSTVEPATGRIAAVVEFTPRTTPTGEGDQPSLIAQFADRVVDPLWWWTSKHVDDWGRDDDLSSLAWNVSRLRWSVSIGGADRVRPGAGLFIINERRWSLAPVWTALALGAVLDRPVRFAGRPELPLVGPLLQRIGGLLAVDDDIAGALRSEQLIVVAAEPTISDRRCGAVDPSILSVATDLGAAIYPTATGSSPVGRVARADVADPLRPTGRAGILGSVELADSIRAAIDGMLSEFGQPADAPSTSLSVIRAREGG